MFSIRKIITAFIAVASVFTLLSCAAPSSYAQGLHYQMQGAQNAEEQKQAPMQNENAQAEKTQKAESTKPPAPPTKADFSALRQATIVQIDQVIDPLRLRLTDGRIVQLSGIDIPDLFATDGGDFALAAKDLLAKILPHKQVRLYQTKDAKSGRTNRMGYELAQIETVDGDIWIQGLLIQNGQARARPDETNPEMAAQMYALETKARAAKRGLWQSKDYAVRTPNNAESAVNSFAVIEGTIKSVANVRNTAYLNFGNNWRDDFTIAIASRLRSKMLRDGTDIMALGGKRVRVHGWVESYNGPFVRLTDAAQLELLDESKNENTPAPDTAPDTAAEHELQPDHQQDEPQNEQQQ